MSRNKNKSRHVRAGDAVTRTADGFLNLANQKGLGADNLLSRGTYALTLLSQNHVLLETMYRSSWLAGVGIDAVAEDMTRGGITITGEDDPKDVATLQTRMQRLGIWSAMLEAIKWARLYGGSLAVIVIDGQDMSTKLDLTTVKEGAFKGLRVYDRWQLQPSLEDLITEGMDAGLPKYYGVVDDPVRKTMSNIRIHHSRCIRLIGVTLPWRQAQVESLWGQSILERAHDRMAAFDSASMGTANLVERAYLRTVKIKGLREILAAEGPAQQNLIKMFAQMRLLQNSEGLTILDTDDDLNAQSYTFAGLSDVLLQFGQQIAGAFGIPLVRLFGQSPAGLNSTGDADLRMYYDSTYAQQEAHLREGVMLTLRVLYRSTFGRDAGDDFDFKFVSLWQTSEKEKAEITKTVTDSVGIAMDKGIIKQSTALKELKQLSGSTGIYSNITEEEINEADQDPPEPVESLTELGEPEESSAIVAVTNKKPSTAFDRMTRWLRG